MLPTDIQADRPLIVIFETGLRGGEKPTRVTLVAKPSSNQLAIISVTQTILVDDCAALIHHIEPKHTSCVKLPQHLYPLYYSCVCRKTINFLSSVVGLSN